VKRLRKIIIGAGVIFSAVIVISSCAKIARPTGGPKDVTPPVILASVPENGSTSFSEKSFRVTFDEFVTLDKINEKFMVSPPIGKNPEIALKGKTLVVSWEEDLADSTTYTFYFQDAIRDNNEGNTLNNYSYVFSTGKVLDSLTLTGNILNAGTLEAETSALIMLYSNLADTAPLKTMPSYISKPDASGGFTVMNMKPGTYRLYALNDLNGNKMFDGGEEGFAFYDSVITVTPEAFYGVRPDTVSRMAKPKLPSRGSTATASTSTVKPDIFTLGKYQLYMFTEKPVKQYLTSSDRSAAGSLVFTLAVPADTSHFDFTLAGIPDTTWYLEHNSARDTFRVWITDPAVYASELLTAVLNYPYTDSTNTLIYKEDSVKMRFFTREERTQKGKKPTLKPETNISATIKPVASIFFRSKTPFALPDTSKIKFVQKIDTVSTVIKPEFIRDEADSRLLHLKNKLVPNATYTLICNKNSLSDIFGLQNDSLAYKFRVTTAEEYGILIVTMKGYDGNVIIQLLNEKEKVIAEKRAVSPGKVTFDFIEKGKYRLKAIYDLDNDGRITTGDFLRGIQPEPVSYYDQETEVLVNWEIEVSDWDLGERNRKSLDLRNKPESKSTKR